jgi:hypothetical protein
MSAGFRAAALAMALALIGGACSDDDTDPTLTLPKEEFIPAATEICETATTEIDTKTAKYVDGERADAERVAGLRTVVIPEGKQLLNDLVALGFPASDQTTLFQLVADTSAVLDRVNGDPYTWMDKLRDLNANATGGENWYADISKRWSDYGLPVCAPYQIEVPPDPNRRRS